MHAHSNATVPRLLAAAVVLAAVALAATSASALTLRTTSVVHLGQGAARLTAYTDGTRALYVNLKGLTPGTWNEHLWSGTCGALGTRVAVLPGLAVSARGAIARTNVLTPAQSKGRTLRIVHGAQVLCATFGTGAAPTPSGTTSPSSSQTSGPSASASVSASPSASASATASASASGSPSASPSQSEDH